MSKADTTKYNICSVLIHAHKNKMEEVIRTLEKQMGVEVHGQTDNGRLIVTVEDEQRKAVGERIMGFYEISGVLSASMIYQFSDDEFNEQETIEINTAELKSTEERMSA